MMVVLSARRLGPLVAGMVVESEMGVGDGAAGTAATSRLAWAARKRAENCIVDVEGFSGEGVRAGE